MRVPTGDDYIADLSVPGSDNEVKHWRGVPWFEASVPPHGHSCFVQTKAVIGFDVVLRCACGAIALPRPYDREECWMERNSRR